jgi:hypothetical protein
MSSGGHVRVEPYTIDVAEEVLTDLRSRLTRARWPAPLPVRGWAAGTELGYLRELVEYWLAEFDWQGRQRYLNSFPSSWRSSTARASISSISAVWGGIHCPW